MIRTRFAPSPTGLLHIGGARTALFNWLFAKKNGGEFILRIEDTDQERSRQEYTDMIYEDMSWLGLVPDESPWNGGECGPYIQSERRDIYEHYLAILKETGAVYPCFCSPEQLEEDRKIQLQNGNPPRYNGRCRSLTTEEIDKRISSGERPCWRFAVPDSGTFILKDIVHGDISFNYSEIGDFIVERSDGWPTYLFTAALDDALMHITHVIRGDEHIKNAVLQTLIQENLGLGSPLYGHVPMIISIDRQKLSKRTGAQSVREFREKGFLPEALIAYLSTLSWSADASVNLLSQKEIIDAFSIDHVSSSSPVHDETHLNYWQTEALRARGAQWMFNELVRLNPSIPSLVEGMNKNFVILLLEDISGGCLTPHDVLESSKWLFASPDSFHENKSISPDWMPEIINVLREITEWEPSVLDKTLRSWQKEKGLKGKEFFHPLRLLLSGEEKGSAIPLEMAALGKENTIQRLGKA